MVDPAGYKCTANSDITGLSCDIKRVSGNLTELAHICDSIHSKSECNGFNSHGWLKRCVQSSCGAKISPQKTSACVRIDVPSPQQPPSQCESHPTPGPTPPPYPTPPTPPTPKPPPPSPPSLPTNCSGEFPPFGAPSKHRSGTKSIDQKQLSSHSLTLHVYF